jgi:exodeoxyribonuclease V alpha subunit
MRSWKRGTQSRGIRNAMSYAFDGTCDAHDTSGIDAAPACSGADTVARFTVVDGLIAHDPLSADQLCTWIEGANPATGERRGRAAHSPSADLILDGTINFPKSYSIAVILHPDLADEFEALQDRMRDRILLMWQRELNARRGAGGRIRQDISRLEVVELRHRRSRALDPHIHRHLWLNMRVQGTDGKWSSVDSRVALKLHTVVNAEGELAARTDPQWIAALASHGYTVDSSGEIAELAHVVRPLSRRSTQIEANRGRLTQEWRQEHGGREPGPADLQHIDEKAWAQHRPNKPGRLDEAEWEARVADELAQIDAHLLSPRPAASPTTVSIADLDRMLLAGMALLDADARSVGSNGRYSPWDVRAGAIRAVAAQHVIADREVLEELIDDVTSRAIGQSMDLIPDDSEKPSHIKALMAKSTVLLKMRVWNRFAELSANGALPDLQQLTQLAARVSATIDSDQLAAAAAIAGTSRLVAIIGPAGSGKTTLLRVAADALLRQRRRLVVVAPSRKAALVAAREVGTEATSVHALLAEYGWRWTSSTTGASPWVQLRPGDIDPSSGQTYRGPRAAMLRSGDRIVVDEAGMLDLQAAHALAIVAAQTGAGIAMIGDPRQAAPVGHRGAMATFTKLADDTVELRNVHRFDDPTYAELTLRLRGADTSEDAVAVADELIARGHVLTVHSEEAAPDVMADAWFAASERGERVALVTATNHEAEQINHAIQARRLEAGVIDNHSTAMGRDGQHLLIGDVVQTRRNDKKEGVQNRATWRISGVDDVHLEIERIDDTTDVRRVSHAYAANHVHLAYATTVHGIQGETTDTAVVGPGVDAAGLYVGLTRGRRENHALVVANGTHQARTQLVGSMQRGLSELTLEESRQAATIDLRHAARPAPPVHQRITRTIDAPSNGLSR